MRGLLPTRLALDGRESLDGFLERLAVANGFSPPHLLRLLTTADHSGSPTAAFLMFKPDRLIVSRVASLSGVDEVSVAHATLLRFGDGLPLYLDGLDPLRRQTFRDVVTQGWFPQLGSQVCPMCLAQDGIWKLEWRLPLVATCPHHGAFLVTHCSGCGRRFRTHRYSPLRPLAGPNQLCANPMGLRNPCRHSVLRHVPVSAPPEVLRTGTILGNALAGETVSMLGRYVNPRLFLAETRHLATLLLHLLSRQDGPQRRDWANLLHAEARARTTNLRGPRWGISPPESAVVRGRVLTEATDILQQTQIEDAAIRLGPWLSLIAEVGNGPSAWLVNRTTRTPTMEQLIHAAVSQRHHVGRRLNNAPGSELRRESAIPQLIDTDIYYACFDDMLGGFEWTGRLYVSLCMIRVVAGVANWSDAACRVGLDPEIGTRTARAASARMRVSPEVFAAAVNAAVHMLPSSRDFREREARVCALTRDADRWFETWRMTTTPHRRPSSSPFAITWMWCEVAQGLLDASPAWAAPPAREIKASYRVFRDRLPEPAQAALRSLVLDQSSLRHPGG
ncbi:TniQ family protein [Mycolicibacterium septicum]|nr:TniQ family protein [Mycolicibacterium septicum]